MPPGMLLLGRHSLPNSIAEHVRPPTQNTWLLSLFLLSVSLHQATAETCRWAVLVFFSLTLMKSFLSLNERGVGDKRENLTFGLVNWIYGSFFIPSIFALLFVIYSFSLFAMGFMYLVWNIQNNRFPSNITSDACHTFLYCVLVIEPKVCSNCLWFLLSI